MLKRKIHLALAYTRDGRQQPHGQSGSSATKAIRKPFHNETYAIPIALKRSARLKVGCRR
jgi:hypothetical protein